MTEQQAIHLNGYVALIERFVIGSIDAEQFAAAYMQMMKGEQVEMPESVFSILDRLFADADAYCGDPALREANDIGDAELLRRARTSLDELKR